MANLPQLRFSFVVAGLLVLVTIITIGSMMSMQGTVLDDLKILSHKEPHTATVTEYLTVAMPQPTEQIGSMNSKMDDILARLKETDDETKKRLDAEQWKHDQWVIRTKEQEKISSELGEAMKEWSYDPMMNAQVQWTDADKGPSGKIEPAGAQVVVVSGSDGHSNLTMLDMAIGNQIEYCNYHGYIHHFADTSKFQDKENPIRGEWLKVAAIREAYQKYPQAQWFWWMDTDMLIMNADIDLATHLLHPKILEKRIAYEVPLRDRDYGFNRRYLKKDEVNVTDIAIVASQDMTEINAGSMFLKRCDFTEVLLDIWDDKSMLRLNFKRFEQDTLVYLYLSKPNFMRRFAFVPQQLFNSYHLDWPHWQPGEMVVHFAGVIKNDNDVYTSTWDKYWADRVRAPKEFWYNGERGYKDNEMGFWP